MRLLLDACVLYPTVLREVLIGAAEAGLFEPLWSPRILEEWARTAARTGVEDIARAEIALLRARWPQAEVTPGAGAEAGLSLPDEGDLHVLAAALAGGAETIVTLNLRDFPGRTLGRHGLTARSPDSVLLELLGDAPEVVARVAEAVRARTEEMSGRAQPLRALFKRAALPRTGKALAGAHAQIKTVSD